MINLAKTSASEWTWVENCQPPSVGDQVISQRPGRVGHNYLHLTVTQVGRLPDEPYVHLGRDMTYRQWVVVGIERSN